VESPQDDIGFLGEVFSLDLETGEARPSDQRGRGRVVQHDRSGFVVICLCQPEGVGLFCAENVRADFLSWNAKHALGGWHVDCRSCGARYTLSGAVEGVGAPDVIDLAKIDPERCERMDALEAHVLDLANERDEVLWERSARSIRTLRHLERQEPVVAARLAWDLRNYITPSEARRAEVGPVGRDQLFEEARLMREASQRRRRHELSLIARRRGFHRFPTGVRIFRTPDRGAWIDWGDGGRPAREDLLSDMVEATAIRATDSPAFSPSARDMPPCLPPNVPAGLATTLPDGASA
tara:strand:- start:3174 stop:4055 length:882 start_codon:yes stop_codon:yes gene_type:complete